MKKNFLYILVFFLIILNFPFVNAQNSCEIESSTATELMNYTKEIEKELSEISKNQKQDSGLCEYGNYQKATAVFDIAYAQIRMMTNIGNDFLFNTKVVLKGDSPKSVARDEKIFEKLEKKVELTTKNLASKCALNEENKDKLVAIILEINQLHGLYQQTTVGLFESETLDFGSSYNRIRSQNQNVANAIVKKYNPSAIASCEAQNPKEPASFTESLSKVFNFGKNKEKMLETWKRAAAMIRAANGGEGFNDFTNFQRNLLQKELSRQGLSPNMQQVMLQNFNCYKAQTTGNPGIVEAIEARGKCLSMPIVGTENLFVDFDKNFVWKSKNSDEYSKRRDALVTAKSRSVDIVKIHSALEAMTSQTEDTTDMTKTNLVQLHTKLNQINEKLEERIPEMQNNCMKGNPSIVGGCR